MITTLNATMAIAAMIKTEVLIQPRSTAKLESLEKVAHPVGTVMLTIFVKKEKSIHF